MQKSDFGKDNPLVLLDSKTSPRGMLLAVSCVNGFNSSSDLRCSWAPTQLQRVQDVDSGSGYP